VPPDQTKGPLVPASIEQLIHAAIAAQYPDASSVSIIDARRLEDRPADTLVRVTWTGDGVTQIRPLLVRFEPAQSLTPESALLPVLALHGIPVPRLLSVEPSELGSYLVLEQIAEPSISASFTESGMRWELSALGFTYGRTLARIHGLDWAQLFTWLADAEAVPEDVIDEQIDVWWAACEEQISNVPAEFQSTCIAALDWLDARRPVEVSLCLCHGDFRPENVLASNDDVRAVLSWSEARVTDASYDLALLPFDIRALGLPNEDADLVHQAIVGSYVQASKCAIGNLPFYAAQRLLTAGLRALDADGVTPAPLPAFSSDVDELFNALREVMAGSSKPLWHT
jgi:aminoglycoside phosphotransferase (APT) family kinase protein